VAQPTVPPAVDQLDHLGDVLFVLELADGMILPDMPDEGFDVATHRVDIAMCGAEYARILSVSTATMTLHDEAVGHLEASFVAIVVLADFPRLAW
jgi:hypothetical protein